MYGKKGDVPEGEYSIPFGKARVVKEGSDVSIISFSRMAMQSLTAAQQLEEEDISVEVVDLRSLNPLDTTTVVASVQKTGRALVVEEGWKTGGVGGEIASIIMEQCFDCLVAPVKRVAGADVPMPYAKNLEKLAIPQIGDIVKAVMEMVGNRE